MTTKSTRTFLYDSNSIVINSIYTQQSENTVPTKRIYDDYCSLSLTIEAYAENVKSEK